MVAARLDKCREFARGTGWACLPELREKQKGLSGTNLHAFDDLYSFDLFNSSV